MTAPARRWTTPADVKARLRRRWDRGELLADGLQEGTLFPLRLPLTGPTAREITADFAAVRDWIAGWRGQRAITCEWQPVTHRLFGANQMPVAALVGDRAEAVRLLGLRREWDAFGALAAATRAQRPELLPWLARRPLRALALAPDWDRLLAVVEWVRSHPRSGLLLRQIDARGVHTKFLEHHRGTLAELLDLALPAAAVDTAFRGAGGFARRYGFRDKPERIRLRFLDRACAPAPDRLGLDLTVDAAAFATLDPPVARAFITENETNFLAFPDHPRSLVIFGAGYGWSALASAAWLRRCALHYWGDLDTHGFAILDQLRSHFPHARSLLMDRHTLAALRHLWTTEPEPVRHHCPRLTPEEQATRNELSDPAHPAPPRLEQERIPMRMLAQALAALEGPQPAEPPHPSGRGG